MVLAIRPNVPTMCQRAPCGGTMAGTRIPHLQLSSRFAVPRCGAPLCHVACHSVIPCGTFTLQNTPLYATCHWYTSVWIPFRYPYPHCDVSGYVYTAEICTIAYYDNITQAFTAKRLQYNAYTMLIRVKVNMLQRAKGTSLCQNVLFLIQIVCK